MFVSVLLLWQQYISFVHAESWFFSYLTFVFLFVVGSSVSTRNSFEMRVDHVTIWVHADGAHEDEPHADEVE